MISTLWTGLYWTWVASEVALLLVTRTRRGDGEVRDRGSLAILWLVITASITASEWVRYTFGAGRLHHSDGFLTAALAVLIAGLAIRWTAILSLRRSFSVNVAIRQSQTIHKTGLYRFVRHPAYLGLLLALVAIGLHSRNWLSLLLVTLPTTAALLYRIRVEEQALTEAFGTEYTTYSESTSRLFPGIF